MSSIQFDPRTIGRDIPGIFDVIFPQMTVGVVAHFNRKAIIARRESVSSARIAQSSLSPAMLAELAFAAGEQKLCGDEVDWRSCLSRAVTRQRRYFDAKLPESLSRQDIDVASELSKRFEDLICDVRAVIPGDFQLSPRVNGFQWIASGVGDCQIGNTLVEVKFSARRFSAADYRQVVMYWLLQWLSSIEKQSSRWDGFVLLNPRLGVAVHASFNDFVNVISAGRSSVDIAQMFTALIATRSG